MAKPASVLVIDDDRTLVHLVTNALQQEDYAVLTAYDGQEGLRKMYESRPI